MFFVSYLREDNDTVGVTDMKDWVCEYYTAADIFEIAKIVEIKGVSLANKRIELAEDFLNQYINARIAKDKTHGILSNYLVEHTIGLGHRIGIELTQVQFLSNFKEYRVSILHGITELSIGVFRSCDKPFHVRLPISCKTIEVKACTGTPIVSINLDSVLQIGECAFEGCTQLTSVGRISEQCEIYDNAFKGTRIKPNIKR